MERERYNPARVEAHWRDYWQGTGLFSCDDRSKLPELLPGQQRTRWQELRAELKRFDQLQPKALPTRRFAVSDVGPIVPPTYIPGRRDEGSVQPGFPAVLGGPPPNIQPPAESSSSMARLFIVSWTRLLPLKGSFLPICPPP